MKTKNMTIPNWCGKFVSALAVLSVSMFGTSCNDEEFADSTRKPLQLSVTANAPLVSRAIINDTYLPDGSQIGVTLTATDGSAYDNQDFYNLAYSASGTGAEQVWSSATPASLSTTSGKVIAYYPYNGSEELDLTAIPVETASQTDYMYAKPVTGIDFSSADINLNMQHAMTDIRINLKKGTYTGTGDVTKVTVKAAAFATSATMDAETGVFANVSGSGAQFVQEFTELTLTTTAYSQDFLMVPDTKSTSGEVSILTIIDGKKFAVTVPYTESFQQGYSYVYNLTLDNSGLVLEGVDVSKWSVKVKEEQELEFYDNQYIVEIQVPSDGYRFYHNILDFEGSIDWGDGTTENLIYNYRNPDHKYEKAGTYIVSFKGSIKSLFQGKSAMSVQSSIISKIIHIGESLGIESMREAFYKQYELKKIPVHINKSFKNVTDFSFAFCDCTNLTEIPEGLFDYCIKVTSFEGTFSKCKGLSVIPEGLFDNCPEVTSFSYTFADWHLLTTIPEGLFDNNTKVKSFRGTFNHSNYNNYPLLKSIPEGLFDKCTEVTDFSYTFSCIRGEGALVNIPKGLFDYNTKVTSFEGMFSGCRYLEGIPAGLFDHCTEAVDFDGTFQGCHNIAEIPAGLFKNNTKAESFIATFNECKKIETIPEKLFANCPNIEFFTSVFESCNKITEIPQELFRYNTKAKKFEKAFYQCSALTEIPDGLFDNCPEVTNFQGTFYECINLTTIPSGLFDYNTKVTSFGFETYGGGCFELCTKLQSIPEGLFDNCTEVTSFFGLFNGTAITEIPEGLFDKCTKVKNFEATFNSCNSLQAIPEGLFDNCPEVTTFEYTFQKCRNLQTIPEGLFDKCTKVKNFIWTFANCYNLQAIPEGLFDKCTEVTSFSGAFWACTNLKTVPEGLFDKNTKVKDFGYTFYNCKNWIGESPYTIINEDGADTKVHLYERSNYPDAFTAPTSSGDCFYNCTGLTDYSSIPSSWL